MFASHTIEAILALASIDAGATPLEKEGLENALRGTERSDGIISYGEASRRLGRSMATIKRMVKAGRLRGVIGTGHRHIGISQASYDNLVAASA